MIKNAFSALLRIGSRTMEAGLGGYTSKHTIVRLIKTVVGSLLFTAYAIILAYTVARITGYVCGLEGPLLVTNGIFDLCVESGVKEMETAVSSLLKACERQHRVLDDSTFHYGDIWHKTYMSEVSGHVIQVQALPRKGLGYLRPDYDVVGLNGITKDEAAEVFHEYMNSSKLKKLARFGLYVGSITLLVFTAFYCPVTYYTGEAPRCACPTCRGA